MTEKPLVNPLFVETDGKSVLLDVDSGDGFPTGDVREKFAETVPGKPRRIPSLNVRLCGISSGC